METLTRFLWTRGGADVFSDLADRVACVCERPDGGLDFGTPVGVLTTRSGRPKLLGPNDGLPAGAVTALRQDSGGLFALVETRAPGREIRVALAFLPPDSSRFRVVATGASPPDDGFARPFSAMRQGAPFLSLTPDAATFSLAPGEPISVFRRASGRVETLPTTAIRDVSVVGARADGNGFVVVGASEAIWLENAGTVLARATLPGTALAIESDPRSRNVWILCWIPRPDVRERLFALVLARADRPGAIETFPMPPANLLTPGVVVKTPGRSTGVSAPSRVRVLRDGSVWVCADPVNIPTRAPRRDAGAFWRLDRARREFPIFGETAPQVPDAVRSSIVLPPASRLPEGPAINLVSTGDPTARDSGGAVWRVGPRGDALILSDRSGRETRRVSWPGANGLTQTASLRIAGLCDGALWGVVSESPRYIARVFRVARDTDRFDVFSIPGQDESGGAVTVLPGGSSVLAHARRRIFRFDGASEAFLPIDGDPNALIIDSLVHDPSRPETFLCADQVSGRIYRVDGRTGARAPIGLPGDVSEARIGGGFSLLRIENDRLYLAGRGGTWRRQSGGADDWEAIGPAQGIPGFVAAQFGVTTDNRVWLTDFVTTITLRR